MGWAKCWAKQASRTSASCCWFPPGGPGNQQPAWISVDQRGSAWISVDQREEGQQQTSPSPHPNPNKTKRGIYHEVRPSPTRWETQGPW